MTTSLPVYDFSTSPEDRAKEQAKIDQAIANAEKAMKDAPAVKAVKAKLVKPKATKTSPAKKAGRVVGISADENIFLKQLLLDIANDSNYNQDAAYIKLQARYNK